MDFPLAKDKTSKNQQDDDTPTEDDIIQEPTDAHTTAINTTELVLSEEQVLLSSQLRRARATISLEYDKLVDSYWKQVEIPTTQKERRRKKAKELMKKKKDSSKKTESEDLKDRGAKSAALFTFKA